MENKVNITIDGKVYETISGKTVLDVARENNIYIPTLCYHPRTGKAGKCRACLVEVEGLKTLKESCALPVNDGMVVKTNTSIITEVRKMIVELHLSNCKHNCYACESNGNCELQDMAYHCGIEEPHFPVETKSIPIDDSSQGILRDANKCIQCGRCIRACNNNVMNEVLDFGWRSGNMKVICDDDLPMGDSSCVQCGECVQVCPVGALTFKTAKGKGRFWEFEKKKTICTYCGVGCSIDMYIKDNKWVYSLGTEENWENQTNKGSLCVKGRFGFDFLNREDRLKTPLIKKNGKLEEATWEEALNLVASKFSDIKAKHGASSLGFFSSARVSNEENFAMMRFARGVIGTNNIDHCARLCHSSTVAGLATTLGSGAMTNSLQEAEKSDVILLTGTNTTWNHAVFGGMIKKAVKQKGVKLIVFDPRITDLAKCADIHIRQKLGSDVAYLMGMQHIIIKNNWHKKEFIEEKCEGWDEYLKSLEFFTPAKVEELSGITQQQLYDAAKMYATSGKGAIYYAMGITQSSHGVDNVKACSNLAMITGNFGLEGTGVNPLRGQNNVQGACDMGALPNVFSGYQPIVSEDNRKKFAQAWGVKFEDMDDKVGQTVTDMVNNAGTSIKGVYIMGENPMMSDPNLHHAEEQFHKLDFIVVQDIFLTETAQIADVVLPACAFAEKTGTFSNTERRVQISRKALNPPEGAKQDYEIIAEIAKRMGCNDFPQTPEALSAEIRQLTPSYKGITFERLDNSCGLRWPCPTEEHPGTPILHIGKFARGKGLLVPIEYKAPKELTDNDYPILLTTGRILQHYHTGSMTRRSVVLNGIKPRAEVEISIEDAEKMKIKDGEKVRITTKRGSIEIHAQVTKRVSEGIIFIPFHFAEAAANILTNDALDPIARIPEYKICAAKIEKITNCCC
ncbi:MAG: formate dehydrogenase subunit alpha [Bacteroidetes bacterium CG2_30_32_10]|nr:MAG: formate dehydrogenase subunit alpha [Bacteroidetes bacterium CG2_30_32_10]